jgi:hypothetical protein
VKIKQHLMKGVPCTKRTNITTIAEDTETYAPISLETGRCGKELDQSHATSRRSAQDSGGSSICGGEAYDRRSGLLTRKSRHFNHDSEEPETRSHNPTQVEFDLAQEERLALSHTSRPRPHWGSIPTTSDLTASTCSRVETSSFTLCARSVDWTLTKWWQNW